MLKLNFFTWIKAIVLSSCVVMPLAEAFDAISWAYPNGGRDIYTQEGPALIGRGLIVKVNPDGTFIHTDVPVLSIIYKGNLKGDITAFVKFKYSVGDRIAYVPLNKSIESTSASNDVKGDDYSYLMEFAASKSDILNGWDIEVAFVNNHGEWDSGDDHKNYSFHFHQDTTVDD